MLQKFGNNFPETELIILSSMVTKINRKGKNQERLLIITNKAIYNIKPNKLGAAKRRIPWKSLVAISTSTTSNEFVLHCPGEYDYRFLSNGLSGDKQVPRDTIIECISKTHCRMMKANSLTVIVTSSENLERKTMTSGYVPFFFSKLMKKYWKKHSNIIT